MEARGGRAVRQTEDGPERADVTRRVMRQSRAPAGVGASRSDHFRRQPKSDFDLISTRD